MSSQKLPKILGFEFPLIDFPESALTDEFEQQIAATLPTIDGLVDGEQSNAERIALLESTAVRQRDAFIAAHGDAFGAATEQPANSPILAPRSLVVRA